MVDQLEQQVVREKARLVAMLEHLKQSEEEQQINKEENFEPLKVFVPKRRLTDSCEAEQSEKASKTRRTYFTRESHKTHQNSEDIRPPYTYAVLIREV